MNVNIHRYHYDIYCVNINVRLSMEINDNDPYQSNNILEREDSQDSQDHPSRFLQEVVGES
jgi:hypothetical protein